MAMRNSRLRRLRCTVIAASVHLMFSGASAWANPTGPQVITGGATIQQGPGTLNVTNAPGTIINWQGFSIGAQELTRFIQQSPSSAVLNRVVGGDISQIHGQLLSNGRVFLINPSGIVIGPGATVDTAGFVASTLNMLDGDFIAGKLKFQGDASSGSIVNQGWIRTGYGGQVILIAPHIENSGLIHTPGGELILAAGQKLTITSMQNEGVQFEVQAPTDSVLNVGQLLADGGAVGVFAGTLRHSGDIRANALVQDEAGRVVLKAQSELQTAAGSTISADGGRGGSILLQAGQGHARVAGQISAQGGTGQGGDIRVLGERVSIVESAAINASGGAGGGQILIGGDFQGNNSLVQNATNVFVGADASLRADATAAGDGGRIIVWSDDKAQFYGGLSARGGSQGGNGGFAEVSGKQDLIFAGSADLGAPKGSFGSLLLDPLDLYVFSGGGTVSSIIDESTDFPTNAATVSPATLEAINGNVSLFASRYMRISDTIDFSSTPGKTFTAQVGVYTPPALPDPLALSTGISNVLEIGADITTNGGAVSLIAPRISTIAASTILTSGGAINLDTSGGTSMQASLLTLNAGAGGVTATSGSFLQLGAVTGGSFTATAPSSISTGVITTSGGPVALTSTGSSISTSNITTGGGNVSLSGAFGIFTSPINTSGSVVLNASSGTISSTVNNAASLTASAAGSIFINSATDLNITTLTAGNTASLSTSLGSGSILPTSPTSQVTGTDVSLITGFGTGGGIGTAGTALNVDVSRIFSFVPNGEFNVLLNGTGPNRLEVGMGVAPTGQSYSGTLTKNGGGLSLSASATDSTVTLSNLSITSGFDQVVGGQNPSIQFEVPNGALVATSVAVPAGSASILTPLRVTLRSSGDMTVSSYTRASGGPAKETRFFSSGGSVTLGAIDASNDFVTIDSVGNVTLSSLITTGDVLLTSSGSVLAQASNPGFEISAGGIIDITAAGIGTSAFANPLDLTAQTIALRSHSGGAIGGASPLIANTQNLVLEADLGSTFNVSTGAAALTNLSILTNAGAVGNGGTAQVRTEVGSANERTYIFSSDGTDFTLDLSNVPASHFSGGTFSFITNSGNINLTGNTDLGTGSLALITPNSINGSDIAAANVSLTASNTIDTDTGAITATGDSVILRANTAVIAGDINAPTLVDINRRFCCTSPTVSVGNIGNLTAPQTVTVTGSTVGADTVTGAGNITMNADAGLLTVGGAITTTDSTINLTSNGGTPFQFTEVSAGASGTVQITSANGIEQTGGAGITAGTVSLLVSSGEIFKTGSTPLVLTSTSKLTLDADGDIRITATGTALTELAVTERASLDSATIDLALFGTQSVAITGGSTDFDVAVSSPSALKFTLDNAAGGNISLVGGGITTSGGAVSLTSQSGVIDTTTGGVATGGGGVTLIAGGAITNGSIVTSGGSVALQASGGDITTGTINTGGGALSAQTFCVACDINVNGDLTAGAGTVFLGASSGNIAGSGIITSGTSVTVATSNGEIGASGTPLTISAPSVLLQANRGGLSTGDEGTVWAALADTTSLNLTGAYGFDITLDTALSSLSVSTRGSGAGPVSIASTAGQTFSFLRPASDLFNPVTNTFQIVAVGGTPLTTGTFAVTDGTLLVAGPGTINATNLNLFASNGADISLQGTSADPLSLTNAAQTFSASGGAAADILIRGKVTLAASASQSFNSSGSISVNADALGGGGISITAPDQTFTTTGAASKMEFLGGAAADEKVTVSATNSQLFSASTALNSPDMLLLRGGSGEDASVTIAYTGSGDQRFQTQGGIFTIEGGSGQNSFAEIEHTGSGQQQICRNLPFTGCSGNAGTLNILGGSGAGAYGQMTASGSQFILVSSATNVKAGTGNGSNALLQAGTAQSAQLGNLTVEGKGGVGATATAQILAGSSQTLSGSAFSLLSGPGANSFARIAASGSQSLNYSSLNMSASGGGNGSFVQIQAGGTQNLTGFGSFTMTAGSALDTDAIIEGNSQTINGGTMTLTGGTGASGSTSDALIRNLSGNQNVLNTSSITLNGGIDYSTTGILNLGAGTQTLTSSGALSLSSNAVSTAAAPVQVTNSAASLQTINVQRVSVQTNGGGEAALSSAGNQYIHTNNSSITDPSIRVTALGSGTASIQATGSQLLEVDYPQLMQATRNGELIIGDTAANGNSLVLATDQAVFAGSIVIEGGQAADSASKLSASNTQAITTLQGGIDILGGSGTNSLATIDPIIQTILVNGPLFLLGGSGSNADASIVSTGAQTILTTNGNILLTGGPGSGADAFISGGSPQQIFASGSIILQPVTGDAFISGPPSVFFFDTTSLILPLEEELEETLSDAIPAATEDPLSGRELPICR
jgi:filamentous hemagglutinin family protein